MPSRPARRAAVIALATVLLIATGTGTASAAVQQPPGGPILVVTTSADPFSTYNTEILRNEGFNDFAAADVSTLTTQQLAGHDTVVLGRTPLSTDQVAALTTWVNGGGNLIAIQPDKQLAPLLGLTDAGGTLDNGNLDIDTTQAPGQGITTSLLQFHGTADLYTAQAGTRTVAALSPGGRPAVSLRTVGAGHAAAFTYDLARSIVYTRQGNPSWAGQNRDMLAFLPNPDSLSRSNDLFFGGDPNDPQPDWVDLNRVAVPQADEQQRLLANMIIQYSITPTPRFWYLPNGEKAAIALTGDDHGGGGTSTAFQAIRDAGPAQCRTAPVSQALLDSWTCPRGTSYVIPNAATWPIPNSEGVMWNSLGFEIADHTWFNGDPSCQDFTSLGMLNTTLTHELGIFAGKFGGLPAPQTTRTHCIAWSDWASQPKADLAHGIRLNTDYYYFPSEWTLNRPGMFTGSGLPMRFADCNGSLIDVYQATTYAADDATTPQGAADNANTVVPQETKALIDKALGAATGYYGAFTIQVHTDFVPHEPARDAILAYAIAHGVPVVSELQLLRWLDGRNASSFSNIGYGTDGTLTFTVNQATGAAGLQAMIPAQGLTALTRNGQAMAIQTQTIKGISYAILPDASGSYTAKYPAPSAARVASSFTGSIAGGSGGGGACEDAGDPGTNPPGGDPGGGDPGGGNPGGGNPGGGNPGGGNPGGGTTGGGGTIGGGSAGGSSTGGSSAGGGSGTAGGGTTPPTETGSGNSKATAFASASAATFRPGSKRTFVVTVRLRRTARVVLTLRTPSGKIARRLRVGRHKAGTVVRLRWDGKDARGRYVAAARYGYSVTAVGSAGYERTARGSLNVLRAR